MEWQFLYRRYISGTNDAATLFKGRQTLIQNKECVIVRREEGKKSLNRKVEDECVTAHRSLSSIPVGLERSLQNSRARINYAQKQTIDVILEICYLIVAIFKQTNQPLF